MVCFAAGGIGSLADNRNLDGSCFAPYAYDSTSKSALRARAASR